MRLPVFVAVFVAATIAACTPGDVRSSAGDAIVLCSSTQSRAECESNTPRVDTTPLGFTYKHYDQHGQPVRWRKCSTVPYVIRGEGVSAGHIQAVHDAFSEAGKNTGLSFNRMPQENRDSGALTSPGRGVVVSLGTPEQLPELEGSIAGLATVVWQAAPTRAVPGEIIAARISLDTTTTLPRVTGKGSFATVALHEIGHALNLGHVPERGALMRPHLNHDLPEVFPYAEQSGLRLLYTPQDC